jgi:hypothetical protein
VRRGQLKAYGDSRRACVLEAATLIAAEQITQETDRANSRAGCTEAGWWVCKVGRGSTGSGVSGAGGAELAGARKKERKVMKPTGGAVQLARQGKERVTRARGRERLTHGPGLSVAGRAPERLRQLAGLSAEEGLGRGGSGR